MSGFGRSTSFAFVGIDQFSKVADKVGKKAGSMGGTIGKAGKLAAVGFAAAATGAAAMGVAGMAAVKVAEQQETANKKLSTVLKSMGYADNAKAARKYADSLEQVIAVDSAEIKAGQTKLATFADIAKSQKLMQRSTLLTADMAAAGFGSISSNAVGLGKALQDPITGMSLLSKAGSLTKQEQKQIGDEFKRTGDKAAAQESILKALEKQVGGVAEASADGSDKIALAFGEITESVGKALKPAFDQLVPVMVKASDWVVKVAIPKFGELFGHFKDAAARVLPVFKEYFGKVTKAFKDASPGLMTIVDTLKIMGKFLMDTVIPAWANLAGKVVPLVIKAVGELGKYLPTIAGVALQVAKTSVTAFSGMFDMVVGGLEWMMKGLAKVPGPWQNTFRNAATDVENFRDDARVAFDGVIAGMDSASESLFRLGEEARRPKEVKLQAKIATALENIKILRKELNSPETTKTRRVEIRADIANLRVDVAKAKEELASINGMRDGDIPTAAYAAAISARVRAEAEARRQSGKATIKAEAKISTEIVDMAEETGEKAGEKAGKKAVKSAAKSVKKTAPDLRGAFDSVMGAIGAALDASRERVTGFRDAAIDLGKSIARGLGNFGEGMADYAERLAAAISPDQMLTNMRDSVAAINEWRTSLDRVAARGLSSTIVEELRAMGLDSADELAALNGMTDAQLAEFATLWTQRDESGAVEGAKQYADDIAAELAALPGQLKLVGAEAMAGLAEGLGSQKRYVSKQVKDALAEMKSGIQDEDDLFSYDFVFEFVPKASKKKGKAKGKKKSKGGGGMGSTPTEGWAPAGLMSATRGAGYPGAKFAQWGPYWSWNKNSAGLGQHDGADISGVGTGTPVYAPRGGGFVRRLYGSWHGNAVEWNKNGTTLTYAHLSRFGGTAPGGVIGYVGSTGNSTAPHLHVQARRNGSYVNPAAYMATGGIVKRRPGGIPAIIGEGRYDEAVIPLKPNGGGVGGTSIVVNVNGGLDSSEAIARRVQTALLDLKRRQGVELGIA